MADRPKRHRVKKIPDHDNADRWMVTYSDLITLLLVFFIVMFSMSTVQNQKFNALLASLKSSFQGQTVLHDMGYPNTNQNQTNPSIPITKKAQPSQQQQSKDAKKLDSLYIKINQYIKSNHLSPQVSLTETTRGVQLTFREKILFDLGKADLKTNAMPILKKIGGLLNEVPNEISVEGYTDNTPYRGSSSSPYKSNWELSGARAMTVMNYLISQDHLQAGRFHFVGYGPYQPVVANDTPAHKAINRRVNIVVIRQAENTVTD